MCASESGPPHACSSCLHWTPVLESIHTGDWETEKQSCHERERENHAGMNHSRVYGTPEAAGADSGWTAVEPVPAPPPSSSTHCRAAGHSQRQPPLGQRGSQSPAYVPAVDPEPGEELCRFNRAYPRYIIIIIRTLTQSSVGVVTVTPSSLLWTPPDVLESE